MTEDNIQTRRAYRGTYINWPGSIIVAYFLTIDAKVNQMHPDEMIEARQLIDERLPLWR